MTETALFLARLQFAFTVSFHIIFPALSIGLASYLMVLEALWLRSGRAVYFDVFQYWLKIFAVVFGVGVVSGLVLSYEFGTNWSQFSEKTGPVIGPLMGYEVLTAFFLEAGFLGIMLFGRERVGPRLHMLATSLVALGTLISAFWIIAANSWMQTPQGYRIVDGRFHAADWAAVIFNPSMPYRLVHMGLAAFLATAFVVGAVGAWHLIRDRNNAGARLMYSMALWMGALVAPIQILAGDLHGLNTLAYQPAKIAAMEGDWTREPGQPFIVAGWPNMKEERTDYALQIPHAGALILTHSWNGAIRGLKEFPPEDRPYAPLVFWSFRLMLLIGFSMAGLGLASLWLRRRGRLYETGWLMRAMIAMGPSGIIAILAGWATTEVGRQPYTVYGLLRTADSVSPVGAPGVAVSLAAFAVIYLVVFGAALVFLLRLMAKPPCAGETGPAPAGRG
jgi:cytochrome bd ubiquinol oxidase subunit I